MGNSFVENKSRLVAGVCLIFAFVFGLALACVCFPAQNAYADVRDTDVIDGKTVAEWGDEIEAPDINCDYAMLIDENGRIFYERNVDSQTLIASITKVMTFIVAYENAPLDTEIYYTLEAARLGDDYFRSYVGDHMPLSTALKALLIASANSEAMVIADTVGAIIDPTSTNPRQTFVDAMNAKAKELGCENTFYTTPHGLDFQRWVDRTAHSSCRDILTIARYAMQYPYFRQIVGTSSEEITMYSSKGGEYTYVLQSTNPLWGVYEGICGIKTGNTALAGKCLLSACNRDGHYIYAVVLKNAEYEDRANNVMNLFNWYYAHKTTLNPVNSVKTLEVALDQSTVEVPVFGYVSCLDYQDKLIPVTLGAEEITVEYNSLYGDVTQQVFYEEITGPINAWDVVGHVVFTQGNTVLGTYDLYACESVPEMTFWEKIRMIIDKFIAALNGLDWGAESYMINDMPYDEASFDKSLIAQDK